MRVLRAEKGASSEARGVAHGRAFAGEIAALAELRLYLARTIGAFESDEAVLEVAAEHLSVLEAFDADLHAELMGIAEGSGVDAARLVVLNHYTDLRDLGPAFAGRGVAPGPEPDGCTALWARTPSGAVLAQTWDMHASAMPFVMMLEVPEGPAGPRAWTLSLTGCLGMAGMNAEGLGVTINNLRSTDARVGVLWPALVRALLGETSRTKAREVLARAPVGSGHHYLLADPEGAVGVETSGRVQRVVFDGREGTFHHTNHCLAPGVAEVTSVAESSTTHDRYARMEAALQRGAPEDREVVWRMLSSTEGWPRSVCTYLATPQAPHAMATCATLVMDLERREILVAPGMGNGAWPHCFELSGPVVE